jgi:hypothetical protein
MHYKVQTQCQARWYFRRVIPPPLILLLQWTHILEFFALTTTCPWAHAGSSDLVGAEAIEEPPLDEFSAM